MSRFFRFIFWVVLLGMLVLVVVGLLREQPAADGALSPTQVEQTVQAAVVGTQTAIAVEATATTLPDIEATVEARLQVTPTPTPPPPEGLAGAAESALGGVWSIIRSLWNIFAFGGIGLQLCCCLLIPGGLLLLLLNDTRPRR
ncbi:MAG: hypothetical protein K8L99_12375 [Anaerolineae bacterium]|nr:hypothetical protein [Anaerolineae bacterium]